MRFIARSTNRSLMIPKIRPGPPTTLALGALILLMSGCQDFLGTGAPEPSALESVIPARGEAGVSVLASMILRFVQPVDPSSVRQGVALLEGAREVWTDLSSQDDRTFVLTPSDPLDFGTRYTVRVSRAVTRGDGSPLLREESWGFITEGARLPQPNQRLMSHSLRALAHDSMRGRGSGTVDERKAAHFIAELFEEYGLTTPPTGPLQDFSAPSAKTGEEIASQNVVGMVRGDGPLGEDWIVVGAHYDHIGFRNLPDESLGPNNGADDNASGTALLLELARQYRRWVASGGSALMDRRSVLFVAFGAEEEGLLGSCFYVDQAPVASLARTRAMINFDMVGRLRGDHLELLLPEASDTWYHLLGNANESGLAITLKATGGAGGTDYVCFGHHGIPFVGFFTGSHPEYHTPDDDAKLINLPGMRRVGALGLRVLSRLVVMPGPPTSP